MIKYITSIIVTLALMVPTMASQFIKVETDPCLTYDIQLSNVMTARPDVTIESPMDDEGVVIYKQVDDGNAYFVASHFNEDGCLDGVLVMNEEEYRRYFGVNT